MMPTVRSSPEIIEAVTFRDEIRHEINVAGSGRRQLSGIGADTAKAQQINNASSQYCRNVSHTYV
jgi:hypothetical protein